MGEALYKLMLFMFLTVPAPCLKALASAICLQVNRRRDIGRAELFKLPQHMHFCFSSMSYNLIRNFWCVAGYLNIKIFRWSHWISHPREIPWDVSCCLCVSLSPSSHSSRRLAFPSVFSWLPSSEIVDFSIRDVGVAADLRGPLMGVCVHTRPTW